MRYNKNYRDEGIHYAKDVKLTDRKCMTCEETFKSEGSHNRICRKCKSTDDWRFGSLITGGLGIQRSKKGSD